MTQPSLKCQEQKAKRKFHQPICTFAYLIRVSLFAAREKKSLNCGFFPSVSPLFNTHRRKGTQAHSIPNVFPL